MTISSFRIARRSHMVAPRSAYVFEFRMRTSFTRKFLLNLAPAMSKCSSVIWFSWVAVLNIPNISDILALFRLFVRFFQESFYFVGMTRFERALAFQHALGPKPSEVDQLLHIPMMMAMNLSIQENLSVRLLYNNEPLFIWFINELICFVIGVCFGFTQKKNRIFAFALGSDGLYGDFDVEALSFANIIGTRNSSFIVLGWR